jgi:transcriptional regulator with XRE-family HTH domain
MSEKNYNRIKELLAKKEKKNIDLAKAIGVDPNTVSSWCNNYSQPEFVNLFKISDYLNVEAGELLTLRKDLRKSKEKGNSTKTAATKRSTTKKK